MSPSKAIGIFNTIGGATRHTRQLEKIAQGKEPDRKMSIAETILEYLAGAKLAAKHLDRRSLKVPAI
jgi:hypothetical protein